MLQYFGDTYVMAQEEEPPLPHVTHLMFGTNMKLLLTEATRPTIYLKVGIIGFV